VSSRNVLAETQEAAQLITKMGEPFVLALGHALGRSRSRPFHRSQCIMT
jgi:hypothetical protein